MKYNHLNVPSHWKNYWTRYPEGHTILEALISWVSQVDGMVDNQNELNETVETYGNRLDEFIGKFDTHLQETVGQTLSEWQQSGFLNIIINEALDTKYHEMNDRLSAQMTYKVGGGAKAQLEDLAPNVISAIEGGEGATFNLLSEPQEDSVGLNKINRSLTEFIGKKVVVNKGSAYPDYFVQSQYTLDVTNITVLGSTISALFDFYTESSNVKYLRVAYFLGSDPNNYSTTPGTFKDGSIQTFSTPGKITEYSNNTTGTFGENNYLHLLVRVGFNNQTIPTTYYQNNVQLTIDGVSYYPKFNKMLVEMGEDVDVSDVEYLDSQLVTRKTLTEYISETTENSFLPYSPNYIFFKVKVNQNFANNTSTSSNVQDLENLADVSCALKLPESYTQTGKPVPLVMFAHGAGGQVTGNDAGELKHASDLVSAGYAVFDVNGSNDNYIDNSDHMGSSRALSAYLKAYEWIKSNYNVTEHLFVHGHSMGGLTALNFAVANPWLVRSVGVYYPVTDLYNQAWLKPWFGTTKARMAIEYNFDDKTGATYEADKVVGFNPIENNTFSNGTKKATIFPVPLKIWHGTADTAVSITGTQAFVNQINNGGGKVEFRTLTGVDHTPTATMKTEEVMWFNRFN